jgi:hypothetical protein
MVCRAADRKGRRRCVVTKAAKAEGSQAKGLTERISGDGSCKQSTQQLKGSVCGGRQREPT